MCGCGICGMVGICNKILLKKMCRILQHRGPNDEGYYIDDKIAMGIRRLSIIDISKGHQPIHNEDESIWTVCNGEIYNYKKLKENLEKRGHKFYTEADTEVIVHLYEEYGDLFVKSLRGMFSIALWDNKNKKLILARDRLGIKPLFYYFKEGKLFFGSEIKSILQNKEIKREVNLKAINHYLAHLYIPAPLTAFKKIKKLLQGHILIYKDNNISIKEYWDLKFDVITRSEEVLANQILEKLKESVEMRLMSDVPLGAFLSGGIDSSAIVGLMTELTDQPVKTFSIGFGEKTDNELKYAKTVADHFQTDHHEFEVRPDAFNILPKLVWELDEPFGDFSSIPTYCVSEMAKKYVTVVLSGDGGDELFAGYPRYMFDRLTNYYRIVPSSVRKFIYILSKPFPDFDTGVIAKGKKFLRLSVMSREEMYANHSSFCIFDNEDKRKLYSNEFPKNIKKINSFIVQEKYLRKADKLTDDFLTKLQYTDIKTYLPEDILVKVDRMSMLNSLEARVPFLDHEFVELTASIPSELKLKRLTSKYIFRKAVSGLLSKEIIRRGKKGFSSPINSWFREDLKDLIPEILLSSNFQKRKYFNQDYIKKILVEHKTNFRKHGARMGALLMLELWHRQYIDSDDFSKQKSFDKLVYQ